MRLKFGFGAIESESKTISSIQHVSAQPKELKPKSMSKKVIFFISLLLLKDLVDLVF